MKPSAAASYIDIIRERFDSLRTQEKRIREAAALVVDRVLNKGTLWIYDRRGGALLGSECESSRLFLTDHRLTPESVMKRGDVLLIGAVEPDTPEDLELARRAKKAGAEVIALAATSLSGRTPRGKLLAEEADIAINNRSPEASGVLSAKGIALTFCPAAGVMNDCIFWALCAAVADKLLARGKTTHRIPGSASLRRA